MEPKEYLRKMINHTIAGETEEAEAAFKDYLVPKTIEVLGINKEKPAATPEVNVEPTET